MSLKNKELIEKNRYELTFDVERAKFDDAVTTVYRRQVKKITVPGFRRGKAPRSIIEKMYGKGVFHEDAISPRSRSKATRSSPQPVRSLP